jgi:CRP-like cAMP-binding protein
LSEMSEFDRISLARAMTPYICQPGNVIVKKGDDGDAFHIVHEGRLKVTDISVGGTKFDDVILGPGDYFGERALATNEPTAANVVATTKGFGFRIDRHTFERVLGEFSRVIMKARDRNILVRFVSKSPFLRSTILCYKEENEIGTNAFFVDRTLSHKLFHLFFLLNHA